MPTESYALPTALQHAVLDGQPVPTTPAQAAELERINGAKHAAKVREKITVTGTGPFEITFPGEEAMRAVYLDASVVEMLLNYARSFGRVEVRVEALADAERRCGMNTETTPCPRVPCSTDECENLTSGYSIGSLRPLCDSCIAKREEEEDEETPRQRRSAERWDRDMQAYKERGL